MNCMKCGREIPEDDVFCAECLADMEKYPVKSGTVVFIPNRTAQTAVKRVQKRVLPPEEQIRLLNRRIRRLWGALILSGLLTAAAIGLAVYGLHDEEIQFLPGQNYTSEKSGYSVTPK